PGDPGSGFQLYPAATTAEQWTVCHLHPEQQRLVVHHQPARTAHPGACPGTSTPHRGNPASIPRPCPSWPASAGQDILKPRPPPPPSVPSDSTGSVALVAYCHVDAPSNMDKQYKQGTQR